MAHAWDSRVISSRVLIRRASMNTCWPSTTVIPAAASAASTGISATSMPSGSPGQAVLAQHLRDLGRDVLGDARASGWKAPRSVEIPARAPVRAAPSGVAGPSVWSSQGL